MSEPFSTVSTQTYATITDAGYSPRMSKNVEAEPGTTLALFEDKRALTAVEVYVKDGGVDSILAAIKKQVADTQTDISTPKGRTAVKSLAHKVARTKTALLEMGLGLTEEARKRIAGVNADKKRIETELDALKADVLSDLTAWEEHEAARVKAQENALDTLDRFGSAVTTKWAPDDIENQIAIATAFANSRDWEEFRKRAINRLDDLTHFLNGVLVNARYREAEERLAAQRAAEVAEAERQRLAQEQADREAEIARVAADGARIEAEQAAEAEARRVALETYEREKAADIAREAERVRVQNEALAAAVEAENRKQRELAAERERAETIEHARVAATTAQRLAEERAEAARIKAHGDALASLVRLGQVGAACESAAPRSAAITALEFRLDRVSDELGGRDWEEFDDRAKETGASIITALERLRFQETRRQAEWERTSEVERLRFQEAERQRAKKELDDKIAADNAEAEKRATNVAHRRGINRSAVAKLVGIMQEVVDRSAEFDLEAMAQDIVTAMAKGQIPHCKIEY